MRNTHLGDPDPNDGEPTISNCTFYQNYATSGGGMLNQDADPIVSNCVFRENVADDHGGGMENTGGKPLLTDCLFERNESGLNGGGLSVKGGSGIITISGCDFSFNKANTDISQPTAPGGGGAFFGDADQGFFSVVMTDCEFRDNTAFSGGGVYLKRNHATFTDCDFITNTATGTDPDNGFGGGAYVGGDTPIVTMTRCDFIANRGMDGCGVYIKRPHVTFTLCRFIDNRPPDGVAGRSGGGVWARIEDEFSQTPVANKLKFYNTLFLRNECNDNGGAVYLEGRVSPPESGQGEPDPEFGFSTFVQNRADNRGGGIYHMDESGPGSPEYINPRVSSCILWENGDQDLANCDVVPMPGDPCTDQSAQVHNASVAEGEAVFRYSCVQGFSDPFPNGTTAEDPHFLDKLGLDPDPENDFWLGDDSPCVDAADSEAQPFGVYPDLAGNERRVDDAGEPNSGVGDYPYMDMGVYESPAPPYIMHDRGDPFARAGYSDYVDARMESTDGVNVDLGIDRLLVVFSEPVVDFPGATELTADAFTVDPPGAVTIDCIGQLVGYDVTRHLVLIEFTDRIPLQQWTTVIADVWDLEGNRIRTPIHEFCTCTGEGCPDHPDRPDRIVVGYLPGDVDQDGLVYPYDLLKFRQYANEVEFPARGVVADYTDTNRNGEFDVFDLLTFRQLVNGVSPPATREWNGESLPPRPCVVP